MASDSRTGLLPSFTNPALSARRFPLALLCALGAACVVLSLSHDWRPADIPDAEWAGRMLRWLGVLAAGYFLFIGVHLLIGFGRRHLGYAAAGAGFALLLYLQAASHLGLFFAIPGMLLFVMAAPFLPRQAGNATLWNFNHNAWLGGFFGIAAGILLAAALWILYFVIKSLFDVSLPEAFLFDIPTLSFFVVAAWLTLGFLPYTQAAIEDVRPGRGVALIASYILVPFVIAYAVVLYAYAAKIAVTGEVPRGTLVTITGLFIAAAVTTYLIAFPMRESGPLWVRLFHRWIFRVMAVPAGLMLFAIGMRIKAKGLTEARYAVVVLGLWSLAMAALFGFRATTSIRWLPGSLAAMLLLASFGPWGAEALATRSQFQRMQAWLTEIGFIADGKVKVDGGKLQRAEMYRFEDYASFLIDRGQASRMAPWLEQPGMISDQSTLDAVKKAFGID
ncbi:DUF4153 domain-containing protein [Ferrovibrio sp.]|uniref:DUF4153 domain-containing protein n=1 Tax=Ferrovibrio sp. TaxID=1917215 RepID=UPI003D13554E